MVIAILYPQNIKTESTVKTRAAMSSLIKNLSEFFLFLENCNKTIPNQPQLAKNKIKTGPILSKRLFITSLFANSVEVTNKDNNANQTKKKVQIIKPS